MTMRDRLIELLKSGQPPFNALNAICISVLADYLLENGVIVPPCKVGDTVCQICLGKLSGQKIIKKSKVTAIKMTDKLIITLDYTTNLCDADIGRWLFVGENAKEEAEQALKGGVQE